MGRETRPKLKLLLRQLQQTKPASHFVAIYDVLCAPQLLIISARRTAATDKFNGTRDNL